MRLLVCGSREWTDYKLLRVHLNGFLCSYNSLTIIEGLNPRGADMMARRYAHEAELELLSFPADWDTHGKAGGHIRNQQMLDEGRPAFVIGFKDDFNAVPGRGGTEDMIRRAAKADVPHCVVSHGVL